MIDKITNAGTDDRGVSPVIGVILMVAITVILAAVIGSFVLNLGNSLNSTSPSASFDVDFDGATATITHSAGDSLEAGQIDIKVDGSGSVDSDFSGTISSGDSATVTGLSSGDTIRVVWTSSDGSSSATLFEEEAP